MQKCCVIFELQMHHFLLVSGAFLTRNWAV